MQIEIQVLNIEVETKNGSKAGTTYKMADVAYKDLGSGKTQSRKIASFGKTANAFLSLTSNPSGKFLIEAEKDGDFWVWLSATPSSDKSSPAAPKEAQPSAQPQPASKFQEDKDKIQKYIVRQSSLKAAVDYLGNTGNKKATVDDIVQVASQLEAYVFDEYIPQGFADKKSEPKVEFDDNDDVTY